MLYKFSGILPIPKLSNINILLFFLDKATQFDPD